MKDYKVDQLRNVVLLGHGGSGKTSLSEAMLFDSGATTRLGKVEEGTTVSDFDPEEQRRRISVNTSVIPVEWKDHKLNILDAPGYADFVGDVKGSVRVADAAVIVVDASAGVEVGTELVWGYVEETNLPRVVLMSKLDRENTSFDRSLAQVREAFHGNFVPLQMPIGSQADFQGVVDLVTMTAYLGPKGNLGDVPADLQTQAATYRQHLIELAAEGDDELIMKYLEGEDLTEDEIQRGLRIGIKKGSIIPVLASAATANVGIQALLDAIINYLPSPAGMPPVEATNPATGLKETLTAVDAGPLAALVFKTAADPFVGKLTYFRVYSGTIESGVGVFNARAGQDERVGQVYVMRGKEQIPVPRIGAGDIGAVAKLAATTTGDTLCDRTHPLVLEGIEYPNPLYAAAIMPKTKTDLDKLSPALARLTDEDPTLRVRREIETGETILWGMGESHIDVAARRLQQKFGVNITTDVPKIPYRETITKTVQAHGRHKKQTGGRGQFGDVWIRFEPLPRGAGFEFVDEIFGGAVPRQYIPAVEKGLREIMERGMVAGYPTVDFRAALYDGGYHAVDSSEMSFKLAAHLAFKEGIPQANPVLLEPIMNVAITVPDQYTGDIMGDLNTRRARVQGMDQQGTKSIITAQVPLAELQRYATDLRSMTQGRGIFTMEFSHYEEVPAHLTQQIVEQAKREAEKE